MIVWNWLQQHPTGVTAVSNLLFAIIWILYLQLFYRRYRRQQRAELVIHPAQGLNPAAHCLLVNMSDEPVHIQCVMAQVETEQEVRTHQVTEYRRISTDDVRAKELLRQGPLKSGDYLLLGRLEDMMRERELNCDDSDDKNQPLELDDVHAFELRAVAIHGPSDHPVGARRRFTVGQRGSRLLIRPEQLHTDQLTSAWHRSQVRQWLSDCFAPSESSRITPRRRGLLGGKIASLRSFGSQSQPRPLNRRHLASKAN